MYYTRHERNMQDAFCNFLHIVSYRCGISTLQPAILFIWIAVSAVDSADPICFIYRIRISLCRKMTGSSFPQGRAYGGQDTDLLQMHLPKANKMLLCTHPKLVVCRDISEIRTHDTSEYPALQDPVRRGIRIIVAWWDYLGSNRRPLRCERSALTNWAIAPCDTMYYSTTWEIC